MELELGGHSGGGKINSDDNGWSDMDLGGKEGRGIPNVLCLNVLKKPKLFGKMK